MRTYTTYRNDIAGQCNVDTSDTDAMAKIDMYLNDSIRTICNIEGGKLRFLEATKDMATVAGQERYQIPNGFRKLIDMYIYSGAGSGDDTIYAPEMIFDPTKWKLVKQYKLGQSDVPYFTYVENTTYSIQPVPSTTGNLITLRGRLQTKNLTIANYTTGSIVSVANGGTAVIGSSTVWTKDMVGRYIQITETTAANGGDEFWYEIGGWTDATNITLVKPYEGNAIVAGAASYVIGQTTVIPEAYDIGVVFRSVAQYWDNQNDLVRGKTFWMKYDGGMEAGYSKEYGGLMLQMITNEGETEEGAWIPPFGSNGNIVSAVPYWYPWQLASGF